MLHRTRRKFRWVAQLCLLASAATSVLSIGTAYAAPQTPGSVTQVVQPSPVVVTKSGPVQGVDDGQMLAWLGIPFAAPPVGKLRWMPPEPPAPWTKTRMAARPGNACAQGAGLGFFATPGGSEDCLYLNVYVDQQAMNRAKAAGEKLPVFVWIHGGGLFVGQADDNNPRALVKDGKAIVVTTNYRLGVFGFFAHPAIDAEGHMKANYGSMDQTFALRWVQQNIAAFGGDPSNVTISGESAGGNSVLFQMLTPYAKGLFQNVVEMSGATVMLKEGYFGGTPTLKTAQTIGEGFAKSVGCSDAKCLRKLSTATILAHQDAYLLLKTVIDGDYLPDTPEALFRSGKFNRARLVSGNTRDEGDFFAALPEVQTGKPMTPDTYPGAMQAMFGPTLVQAVMREYPLGNYLNASKAYAAPAGDFLFACPSLRLKELVSPYSEVWAYEFADRTAPTYAPPVSFNMEAAHTSELQYLFEGFHGGERGRKVQLNALQQRLAERMQRYWTSVGAATKWNDWPQFKGPNANLLQFQLPKGNLLTTAQFSAEHHCNFWNQQSVY